MLWLLLLVYCLYCSNSVVFMALIALFLWVGRLFCFFWWWEFGTFFGFVSVREFPFASQQHTGGLFYVTRTSWNLELKIFVDRTLKQIEWSCFHFNPTSLHGGKLSLKTMLFVSRHQLVTDSWMLYLFSSVRFTAAENWRYWFLMIESKSEKRFFVVLYW